MIFKIIGMAIIGGVLSFGVASLAESLVKDYSVPFQYEKHDENYPAKFENGKIKLDPNSFRTVKAEKKYDYKAVFTALLYLGILLTIITIQTKINSPKVFRNMAYVLFASVLIGFILGFYYAYRNYSSYEVLYVNFNDEYWDKSIYIGLGIAALIFGVDLTTKKPTT